MPARLSSSRFVGRRGELDRLVEIWKTAGADDRAATVLVAGEAGVGKSRLIAELAGRIPEPGLVLVGHCIDLVDRALPFGPIVQVLRSLHRELDGPTLDAVIDPARDELGALLPELHSDSRAGIVPGALFEQLLGVFERLAARVPTLVILEDLHWADASTRELFVFLAHSLRDVPIVLIGTYRSDDLHRRHPFRAVLAELDRSGEVERIDLARFDRDEVRELIAEIVGYEPDDELVENTFTRSDGNAFFAEELLASESPFAESMPPTLRDILLARIDGISEDAQHVLRCAAVIGRSADHRLLAALADLPEPALLAATREAVAQQILVTDTDSLEYRFRHALVREAVEDDLLPGDRVALHTRVAELLAENGGWFDGGPAQVAAELACHWNAAGDAPRALETALMAARAAEQMYAYSESFAHAERMLALWVQVPDAERITGMRHVDVMRYAAEQAEMHGHADRALDYVKSALGEVDPGSDPVTAGLLHERWGRYAWMLNGPEAEYLAHCDEAVRLVPPGDTPARAKVLATYGQQLMLAGRVAEAIDACDEAIRVAQAAHEPIIEGHARNSLGATLGGIGRFAEGLEQLHRARDLALEMRSWADVARAAVNEGAALQSLARHGDAVELSLAGAELARAHGLDRSFGAFLRLNACESLWWLGRWDEMEEQLREVEAIVSVGIDQYRLSELRCLVAVGRGQIDVARAEADRLSQLSSTEGGAYDLLAAERIAIAVAAGAGDLEHAFARALDATQEPASGARLCADAGIELLIEGMAAGASLAAGPGGGRFIESVRELAAQHERWIVQDRWGGGQPGDLDAIRAHVAAELARANGDLDATLWEAAAALWMRYEARPRVAYARWREADARVRAGDRDGAERAARVAYALASEIGSAPVRDAVASLARRARLDLGVDDVAPTAAERYGLTPRELDVLALVAQGSTNRQIGDALFISTKTASVHVSNILAKLSVTNRGEAAAHARRLGLDIDLDVSPVAP